MQSVFIAFEVHAARARPWIPVTWIMDAASQQAILLPGAGWTMEHCKVVVAAAWAWPVPMGLGRSFDGRSSSGMFASRDMMRPLNERMRMEPGWFSVAPAATCTLQLCLAQGVLSRPRVQLLSAEQVF